MGKYRIVEAKIPFIGLDDNLMYDYRYDVEEYYSWCFGLIKGWEKVSSHLKLDHAKNKIQLLKEKETWKVIDIE